MKLNPNELTPVCDKCGKTAPVDEAMSTPEWKVHRVKEPCSCGGRFMARFMTRFKEETSNA